MKKGLIVFGMVAVWFLNMLPVKADAIWEPRSEFYEEHASECEYNNRTYTTSGLDGVVKVYVSPENATVVDTLENGVNVYVSFTYVDEDGIEWGVIENYSDESKTGWVAMDYMDVVYDYISFNEEYGADIVAESGALAAEYAGQTVKFWSYPSALVPMDVLMPDEAGDLPQYSKTFVDEKGLKWGYVGYFYGMKNCWICLDNPVGGLLDLYPNDMPLRDVETVKKDYVDDMETIAPEKGPEEKPEIAPEPEESYEDIRVEDEAQDESEAEEEIVPKGNDKLVFIVCGLVAAVVAVTGGLLVWLKKKKK